MLILVAATVNVVVDSDLIETAEKTGEEYKTAHEKENIRKIEINGIWYNSMEDYVNGLESIYSLQEKYEFSYYSSFPKAIADANNTTNENEDSDKENAVAGIYTDEDGGTVVVLLKDTTENAKVVISRDMTINLGGNTLTFNNNLGIDATKGNNDTLTIDGRLNGSTIIINSINTGARALQVRTDTFIVNGGTYIANFENELVQESTTLMVAYCSAGGKLIMNDCVIESKTSVIGTVGKTISVYGVYSAGETQLTNCDVKAYSTYAVEENADQERVYTTLSTGIYNYTTSTLTLKNCNVIGTQAGVEGRRKPVCRWWNI